MTDRTRSGGFTLLELMVVISILGLLMWVLLPRISSATDAAKSATTRGMIDQIGLSIDEYTDRMGWYPPSSLATFDVGGADLPNAGIEALVLSLFDPAHDGIRPEDEWLVNMDGDRAPRSLTIMARPDLFELADAWGNPLVYIREDDYGRPQIAMGVIGIESGIGPASNPTTGSPYNPEDYQLFSAGPDGSFATTEDNVGNW